jgi:hypothetical protein
MTLQVVAAGEAMPQQHSWVSALPLSAQRVRSGGVMAYTWIDLLLFDSTLNLLGIPSLLR